MLLENKCALITGGSAGLGYEISRAFLKAGCDIFITGRDEEKLKRTLNKLSLEYPQRKIKALSSDVSSEKDCEHIIDSFIGEFKRIDILVNNAGIYGPFGSISKDNWKDWKEAIEINLFGSVYLASLASELMKQNNFGKIIQLSGGGATNPLPYISSYAASKAAVVRYIETLAVELEEFNIDVNAIAPGALNTSLLDDILKNGKGKIDEKFYEKQLELKKTGGVSMNYGVDLCLFLASEKSNGLTGKLISALWDNYEDWMKNIDQVLNSDLYTIRRIVGKDRNYPSGDK
jgi:NAD(P)-dependent dehydrogenase (short-subunit alcohol dehydrogenase family)